MGFLSLVAAFMVGLLGYLSPTRMMTGRTRKLGGQGPTTSSGVSPAHPEKCAYADQAESLQVDLASLTDRLRRLEKEHDDLKSQHAAGMTARQKAEVMCVGLRRECCQQRSEKEVAVKELTALSRAHAEMQKSAEEMQRAVEAMKKTMTEQEQALASMRGTISNKDSLLRTRSAELREAQAFLSTTDRLSHADVLAMVHALNAQVQQIAAQIADRAQLTNVRSSTHRAVAQRERVKCAVGRGMERLLWSMRGNGDAMCVQLALQGSLCKIAARATNAWGLSLHHRENNLLEDIQSKIFAGESTAVCGRWRVLTRQYVKHLEDQDRMARYVREDMIESISAILWTAGESRCDFPQLCCGIEEDFGEKLGALVAACTALAKALGEDIIASDIRLFCPFFDDKYLKGIMDDASEGGRAKPSKAQPLAHTPLVLCTTELGLQRCEKVVGDGGVQESSRIMMLKPQVLLASFVEEMIGGGQA